MITLILECMLLGIVAALVGIFYNYTLQTGSIFCKLGMILDNWAENEDGFKGWIANPLGACIFCSRACSKFIIWICHHRSTCNNTRIAIYATQLSIVTTYVSRTALSSCKYL